MFPAAVIVQDQDVQEDAEECTLVAPATKGTTRSSEASSLVTPIHSAPCGCGATQQRENPQVRAGT